MEQLYSQETITNQEATQHLRWRDLLVMALLTAIFTAIAWQITQPTVVLPKPESEKVLQYFCNQRLTPEVKTQ